MPDSGAGPQRQTAHPVDRAAIAASLNECRDDLHALLACGHAA